MKDSDTTHATSATDPTQVALKALKQISTGLELSSKETCGLVGITESTWQEICSGRFEGPLSEDQVLRISAMLGIFKALNLYFADTTAKDWFTRPNTGPLFFGQRPVDVAIEGGLDQMAAIRMYLEVIP